VSKPKHKTVPVEICEVNVGLLKTWQHTCIRTLVQA